jgi:anthraniloyl-CoA monooxygenase
VFAVHGYPISDEVSTFIVETDEASWRRAGLDEFDVTQPPGASDLVTKVYLEKLFADQIDGKQLLVEQLPLGQLPHPRTRGGTPSSRRRSRCSATPCTPRTSRSGRAPRWRWRTRSRSAGRSSSTGTTWAALRAYEAAARRRSTHPGRGAARASAGGSSFGQYHDAFEPWQFAYHFLSRSITDARLARRAPDFVRHPRAMAGVHGAAPLAARYGGRVAGAAGP